MQHVLDGSYRFDRYGHLLEEEDLPDECPFGGAENEEAWKEALECQRWYREIPRNKTAVDFDSVESWRRDAAKWFGDYIRVIHGSPWPWHAKRYARD